MPDRAGGASRTCLDVLRQELRNGLACAELVREVGGDAKMREQHRENAEMAYTTALRLVAKLLMTEDEMREITDDLQRLRDLLA